MQQQPPGNLPPPPYQQEQVPPPLPPGQNRGVFAAPLPHGQAPKEGSKLDPIESVNILLRFVAVLMIFIATVIVGATKYVPSLKNHERSEEAGGKNHGRSVEADFYDELPRRYSSYSYYRSPSRYSYRSPPYEYSYSRSEGDSSPEEPGEEYSVPTILLGSLSPIKYFLAANSIALFYTVATLGISVASMLMMNQQQGGGGGGVVNDTLKNKLIMLFVVGDLVMVVFLFSAVGSIAASKDAFNSKSDFYEYKFCGSRGLNAFCQKWTAGIVMSTFGAIAYLLLQPLSVFSLTKVKNAAAANNYN